ncbi:hypothetical protein Q5P01_020489 [Channa striata]|uniref:Uncharacterized protein n=1 Tax=Channa striata TaxID=64152 RepID=A0AA88M030_CHASR|nr:hypothetical protein Q5P01_020489 [Channa striata]
MAVSRQRAHSVTTLRGQARGQGQPGGGSGEKGTQGGLSLGKGRDGAGKSTRPLANEQQTPGGFSDYLTHCVHFWEGDHLDPSSLFGLSSHPGQQAPGQTCSNRWEAVNVTAAHSSTPGLSLADVKC